MTVRSSCLYEGTVVHKRLAPRAHAFAYRVFALCLDLDEIDQVAASCRLFSRNRRNVLGFDDRDFGAPGREPVADKARTLLGRAGLDSCAARIELVCYPRLFGYVFNPLSVYFCRDVRGTLGAVIYEVTNTFHERRSYVIPVESGREVISQSCAKQLYVSPFTADEGRYGFHGVAPGESVVVGVNFREGETPVLKTHFRGERRSLTDSAIARLVVRHPLMTAKIIGAIHVEAARLWRKGVPVVSHRAAPAYAFTVVEPSPREPTYA
jgi:hypothetical protein